MYVIIDKNLKVQEDVCIFYNYYSTLDAAFIAAIKDVETKNGKDITVHNWDKQTVHNSSTERVSNGRMIGSDWGVTYNSNYGSYPCARIIIKLSEHIK